MVEIGHKHFYIFEPVTLKSRIRDPSSGAYDNVVVPVYFFIWNKEIYAKCIFPRFKSNTEKHPNGFSIHIPANISFNSQHLVTIKASEFHLMGSEMTIAGGLKYLDACGHKIIGESCLEEMLKCWCLKIINTYNLLFCFVQRNVTSR
jgi:hypothetical protein